MTRGDDHDRSTPKPAAAAPRRARGNIVQVRAPRVSAEERERELAARRRVAALVSGGLHLHVKRQGDRVQAARGSAAARLCAQLASKTFVPEQVLDLRGRSIAEMDDAVTGFLRVLHPRGVKHVSISFSEREDERELREQREEAVITALTRGGAAPLVRAFATPHEAHGGNTALSVLLV